MFDVGFSELVVIGLVALLVLGPNRLPQVARTAGQWMGRLRRFVDGVKRDFENEINSAELSEVRRIKDDLEALHQEQTHKIREIIEEPVNDLANPPANPPDSNDVSSAPALPAPARKRKPRRTTNTKSAGSATRRAPSAHGKDPNKP